LALDLLFACEVGKDAIALFVSGLIDCKTLILENFDSTRKKAVYDWGVGYITEFDFDLSRVSYNKK